MISDFEVIDLGIHNSQYFVGFGCSFTSYGHCCMGIGDNPAEALDDALEIMAQTTDFFDESVEKRIKEQEKMGDKPSVYEEYGEDAEEMYYFVGIRWNESTQ